jgi:hypothetical protein
MPDFKNVKDPTKLEAIPFELADMTVLGWGQESNIGIGGDTAQLNCRYADGMTYVQPMGQQNTALPWKFKGYVSPADCAAWFVNSITPPAEAPAEDAG